MLFFNRKYFFPSSSTWQSDQGSIYLTSPVNELLFHFWQAPAPPGVGHKGGAASCSTPLHIKHNKHWVSRVSVLGKLTEIIKLQPTRPELRQIMITLFQNITFGRTKQEQPLSELICKIIENIISTYSWNPIICMTKSIFMFVCLSCFEVGKTAGGSFFCLNHNPAFWNESTYLFSWSFLMKT